MRQLILLRHGEAQTAPPGGSDWERPLTAQGRTEVQDAAQAIAQAHLDIERVLVSTARRTLETAGIIIERLRIAKAAEQLEALYLAAPMGLLQALTRCSAGCRTVMVIGHNPGLSELACRLTAGEQPFSLRTAGVCLLSFASEGWRDLAADIAASSKVLR